MKNPIKKLSLFVSVLFIAGALFIAIPQSSYAGVGPMTGCCVGDGECLGCVDLNCFTTEGFCDSVDGEFTSGGICRSETDGVSCDTGTNEESGCCVFGPGECEDGPDTNTCIEILGGEIWVEATECSEVPRCNPIVERNVPSLSAWGLIVLAIALGAAALLIIRKRAHAA